jgi:hypothetical protein
MLGLFVISRSALRAIFGPSLPLLIPIQAALLITGFALLVVAVALYAALAIVRAGLLGAVGLWERSHA